MSNHFTAMILRGDGRPVVDWEPLRKRRDVLYLETKPDPVGLVEVLVTRMGFEIDNIVLEKLGGHAEFIEFIEQLPRACASDVAFVDATGGGLVFSHRRGPRSLQGLTPGQMRAWLTMRLPETDTYVPAEPPLGARAAA